VLRRVVALSQRGSQLRNDGVGQDDGVMMMMRMMMMMINRSGWGSGRL